MATSDMRSGPVGVPPAPAPSLFSSLRVFWRTMLATLQTRLDLFTTELGEEAFRLLYLVITVIVGLVCLHTAFLLVVVWFLVALWHTHLWFWVVGGFAIAYFAVAAIAFVVARNMIFNRPRFLGQTMDELKRDVEGLHTVLKPRGEDKP
jgi:uncharacterized membrane protein YqjE